MYDKELKYKHAQKPPDIKGHLAYFNTAGKIKLHNFYVKLCVCSIKIDKSISIQMIRQTLSMCCN
jgi:hypothetical protein